MALYLAQHGKNLPKDQDPGKGLSQEGTSEVKKIAEAVANYRLHVSAIKHSGKKRARQTAEIFAAALNPQKGIQEVSGLQPLDDVSEVAKQFKSDEKIMVVGHLPFMEKLVSFMIAGAADKPILKFQNGGIVCLDLHPDTNGWIIKWALFPNMPQSISS